MKEASLFPHHSPHRLLQHLPPLLLLPLLFLIHLPPRLASLFLPLSLTLKALPSQQPLLLPRSLSILLLFLLPLLPYQLLPPINHYNLSHNVLYHFPSPYSQEVEQNLRLVLFLYYLYRPLAHPLLHRLLLLILPLFLYSLRLFQLPL